jgi:hypothetical protein
MREGESAGNGSLFLRNTFDSSERLRNRRCPPALHRSTSWEGDCPAGRLGGWRSACFPASGPWWWRRSHSPEGDAAGASSWLRRRGGPTASPPIRAQNATGAFPTTGQWSGRYAIEIDYTGTGAAKTACIQVYQGVTPLLSPCLALPTEFVTPRGLSIAIGDYAGGTGNVGSVGVEFDNVTFDEK